MHAHLCYINWQTNVIVTPLQKGRIIQTFWYDRLSLTGRIIVIARIITRINGISSMFHRILKQKLALLCGCLNIIYKFGFSIIFFNAFVLFSMDLFRSFKYAFQRVW